MSAPNVNIDINDIIRILEESETIEEARQRFALLVFDRTPGNQPVGKLLAWATGGHVPKPRRKRKKK